MILSKGRRLGLAAWSALFAHSGEAQGGCIVLVKQKTTVRVAGREYTLVSDQAPEYMNRVAAYVDRKISETALATRLTSDKAAVLTALNIADELMKSHDENSRLRRELMTLRQALADKQQADTQRSHQDA